MVGRGTAWRRRRGGGEGRVRNGKRGGRQLGKALESGRPRGARGGVARRRWMGGSQPAARRCRGVDSGRVGASKKRGRSASGERGEGEEGGGKGGGGGGRQASRPRREPLTGAPPVKPLHGRKVVMGLTAGVSGGGGGQGSGGRGGGRGGGRDGECTVATRCGLAAGPLRHNPRAAHAGNRRRCAAASRAAPCVRHSRWVRRHPSPCPSSCVAVWPPATASWPSGRLSWPGCLASP